MISCIVPAHKEERWLSWSLVYLQLARVTCEEKVEIIIVENGSRDGTKKMLGPDMKKYGYRYGYIPEGSIAKARNYGANMAKGKVLAFVDADCKVSSDFFSEIAERAKFADGGGIDHIRLSRYSLGIYCFLAIAAIYCLWHRIRVGAFWVKREVFEQMGGFRDLPMEDIDFSKRLKKYNTSSLEKASILWSTRKFDEHGDWFWLKGYKTYR